MEFDTDTTLFEGNRRAVLLFARWRKIRTRKKSKRIVFVIENKHKSCSCCVYIQFIVDVLCPKFPLHKKWHINWEQYLRAENTIFYEEKLVYNVHQFCS